MDKRKVIYYTDELNDEFSTAKITPIKIDENYVYDRKFPFFKFVRFFWYRIVATPCAFFYTKIVLHHSWKNGKVLKPFRKKAYFMYGNHTNDIGDPFMPNMFNFPKDVYFIVHPNNVSMPVLGKINPYLGAIPLPEGMTAYKNFVGFIEKQVKNKNCIVIYPEAHIWPYYTKIRNFPETSFSFPVKYDTPVFCFTNTYQKRKFSKKPKIVTYIDGPFYPNEELSTKKRIKDLRDRVYETMSKRAENSNIEVIKYIKKED